MVLLGELWLDRLCSAVSRQIKTRGHRVDICDILLWSLAQTDFSELREVAFGYAVDAEIKVLFLLRTQGLRTMKLNVHRNHDADQRRWGGGCCGIGQSRVGIGNGAGIGQWCDGIGQWCDEIGQWCDGIGLSLIHI